MDQLILGIMPCILAKHVKSNLHIVARSPSIIFVLLFTLQKGGGLKGLAAKKDQSNPEPKPSGGLKAKKDPSQSQPKPAPSPSENAKGVSMIIIFFSMNKYKKVCLLLLRKTS